MANFDPYYEWLGIPPKDQPAHHYRLLGLELYEGHLSAIDAAANRVMAYLQELSNGEEAELAQKILNEVSAARVCLLNTERKAAYDRSLKTKLSKVSRETGSSRRSTPPPLPVAIPLEDKPTTARQTTPGKTRQTTPGKKSSPDGNVIPRISTESVDTKSPPTVGQRSSRSAKKNERKMLFNMIGVLLVIIVGLSIYYALRSTKQESGNKPTTAKKSTQGDTPEKQPSRQSGRPSIFDIKIKNLAVAKNSAHNNNILPLHHKEVTDISFLFIEPHLEEIARQDPKLRDKLYQLAADQAIKLYKQGTTLANHDRTLNNPNRNQTRGGGIKTWELNDSYRYRYGKEFEEQAGNLLTILKRKNQQARNNWKAKLEKLSQNTVKLTPWYQIGPFPIDNFAQGHKHPFPPEEDFLAGKVDYLKPYDNLRWAKADPKTHRIIKEDKQAFYFHRLVHASTERDWVIKLAANDGFKFWVNDELEKEDDESGNPDVDNKGIIPNTERNKLLKITLKKGQNRLLLKIVNNQGAGGFLFQVIK